MTPLVGVFIGLLMILEGANLWLGWDYERRTNERLERIEHALVIVLGERPAE